MDKNKNHSFIAYIDESGCPGLKQKSGSSQWFVLSAFIVRASSDLELIKHRDKIVQKISSQRREIHMTKIKKEDQKKFVTKSVSEIQGRYIAVLSNKCSIFDASRKDLYNEKDTYYNFLGRYLIERISKCCSQLRKQVSEGNGKVKIIFSRRNSMNYGAFRDYLEKLKRNDLKYNDPQNSYNNMNWSVIDIDAVEAISHSERAGLQIADVVTYSFFKAVEKNKFGMVDTSYIKFLKKNTYQSRYGYIGNGVKIIPQIDKLPENQKPLELLEIFKNEKEKSKSLES